MASDAQISLKESHSVLVEWETCRRGQTANEGFRTGDPPVRGQATHFPLWNVTDFGFSSSSRYLPRSNVSFLHSLEKVAIHNPASF